METTDQLKALLASIEEEVPSDTHGISSSSGSDLRWRDYISVTMSGGFIGSTGWRCSYYFYRDCQHVNGMNGNYADRVRHPF